MREHKYRFDIINNNGYQEQYTGLFDNRKQAEEWFNKHGKELMDHGRMIIMVKCGKGTVVENIEKIEFL
jgi:hypothetical protein